MMNRVLFSAPLLLALFAGVGATSQADISAYLSAHNTVREQHGAADLTWDDALASKAQNWVNKCVFQHSGAGENLAAGTGDFGIPAAVKTWTDEASEYNPQNPQASHFTQVVWKSTKRVGCAVADCTGIFPAEYGIAHFYACEYDPVGNVGGEYAENVQA